TQTIQLDQLTDRTPRLCQIAMAADYSLAVAWWRSQDNRSELMLCRGSPVAFDPQGSPTWYAMQEPMVLQDRAGDVGPLLMGMVWSEGGDLVIGHAATILATGNTESRCTVIPWQGTTRDVVVDEEPLLGLDPSVAVLGSGDTMRVFYAYEGQRGVRLRTSSD